MMSDPHEIQRDTAAVWSENAAQPEETATPGEFAQPVQPAASEETAAPKPRLTADQNIRLMLVVIVGVVALFFAFGLLAIFSPTSATVAALAVIATPIASIVAAYYGITLSMQQVRAAQGERERAIERVAAAEAAARESDVWAAQLESALRVAKVKLDAARISTGDVERAAGVDADFF
jgi:hypothetical protein